MIGVSNGGGTILILLSIEKYSPPRLGRGATRSEEATRKGTLKKCGTVTVARRRIFILIKAFSNNSWLRPSCAMTMWSNFRNCSTVILLLMSGWFVLARQVKA